MGWAGRGLGREGSWAGGCYQLRSSNNAGRCCSIHRARYIKHAQGQVACFTSISSAALCIYARQCTQQAVVDVEDASASLLCSAVLELYVVSRLALGWIFSRVLHSLPSAVTPAQLAAAPKAVF